MLRVRAFISGVSNYLIDGATNLPFCLQDIRSVKKALNKGLNVSNMNITTCGTLGFLKLEDFKKKLTDFKIETSGNDIIFFYYTGHATTISNDHYLVFSDDLLKTQDLVEEIETFNAKTKIIILDSCFSGNFKVEGSQRFDIGDVVSEFYSKGYVVLSSSKSDQTSTFHPDNNISLFTHYLCAALKSKFIIKEGRKSLNDIVRLLFFYLELWNKNNPDNQQNPIYRAKIGATIYFDVEDYKPYIPERIYEEHENYIIHNVQPSHHISAKRFSANVILKISPSLRELSNISKDIIKKIINLELFNNQISEKIWKGKPANIIWINFGEDESDMLNNNFLVHATWIDNNQDPEIWYKVNDSNQFIINDIHFDIRSYYDSLKKNIEDNTDEKEIYISKSKLLLSKMITSAEKIISIYNEFLNRSISEEELQKSILPITSDIEFYYKKSGNLDFPPIELNSWDQSCQNLFATIHNLTLYYNNKYNASRTNENKIVCMNMTIKDYYQDLDDFKNTDSKLDSNVV